MKIARWALLALFVIPLPNRHLWEIVLDTMSAFTLGYFWKKWGTGK